MPRASLTTIKEMVYENLSVSPTTYGTLDTNKRFRAAYIDDAIVAADIKVTNLLLRAKQDFLLSGIYSTQSNVATDTLISSNWAVVGVYYTPNGGSETRSTEVSYDMFKMLTKYSGLFNSDYNKGYHTFQDGKIFHNAPANATPANVVNIKYINLSHPTGTLVQDDMKSPEGFESVVANFATAQLLMKRLDRPEESQFYEKQAYSFLQEYGVPQSPQQETTDK